MLQITTLIKRLLDTTEESKAELTELKDAGKITLSIGNHGLIFMQITGINSSLKSYPDYDAALNHYNNYINNLS